MKQILFIADMSDAVQNEFKIINKRLLQQDHLTELCFISQVTYPKTDEQRQRLQEACRDILLFKNLDPVSELFHKHKSRILNYRKENMAWGQKLFFFAAGYVQKNVCVFFRAEVEHTLDSAPLLQDKNIKYLMFPTFPGRNVPGSGCNVWEILHGRRAHHWSRRWWRQLLCHWKVLSQFTYTFYSNLIFLLIKYLC